MKEPSVLFVTMCGISSGTWAYLVAQEMRMKDNQTANQALPHRS